MTLVCCEDVKEDGSRADVPHEDSRRLCFHLDGYGTDMLPCPFHPRVLVRWWTPVLARQHVGCVTVKVEAKSRHDAVKGAHPASRR